MEREGVAGSPGADPRRRQEAGGDRGAQGAGLERGDQARDRKDDPGRGGQPGVVEDRRPGDRKEDKAAGSRRGAP